MIQEGDVLNIFMREDEADDAHAAIEAGPEVE